MTRLIWSCPDCGSPAGEECDPTCPSAAASYAEEFEAELAEPACHVDVITAAADGCYCLGASGRSAA
jgi:hypothetical protein